MKDKTLTLLFIFFSLNFVFASNAISAPKKSGLELTCECVCKAGDARQIQYIKFPSGGCSVLSGAHCDVDKIGGVISGPCNKVVKSVSQLKSKSDPAPGDTPLAPFFQ